jgi:peptide/nickel transport system permease protein
VFARVVYGTSLSLSIGVGATLLACAGGIVLGTAAALGPRISRQLLVRLLDILLAFPELLLALLAIAVLGRGPENTLFAVGLAAIAGYARLVRSQVLQVKLSGYVQHAVTWRIPLTIIVRHIIPNTIRPLLILATIGGQAVLAASAMSFLGLRVTPPTAEWGALLSEGRNFLDSAPGSAFCQPASLRSPSSPSRSWGVVCKLFWPKAACKWTINPRFHLCYA